MGNGMEGRMRMEEEDQKELMNVILESTERELTKFEKHLIIYSPKFKKQIKEIYKSCKEVIKNYQKNDHQYSKSAKDP